MTATSSRVFDGTGDVRVFFFYFENVAKQNKMDAEKPYELLAYLDGRAFNFFFERFTKNGGTTAEGVDFDVVQSAFFEECEEEEEAHEIIRKAIMETLKSSNLVWSLNVMDSPYLIAGLNSEAKYVMLRNCIMRVPELASFAMYRSSMD